MIEMPFNRVVYLLDGVIRSYRVILAEYLGDDIRLASTRCGKQYMASLFNDREGNADSPAIKFFYID